MTLYLLDRLQGPALWQGFCSILGLGCFLSLSFFLSGLTLSTRLQRVLHIKSPFCSLTSFSLSRLKSLFPRVLLFPLPQSLPSATPLAHTPSAETIFPSVLLPKLSHFFKNYVYYSNFSACLPSRLTEGRCSPAGPALHPGDASDWRVPPLLHLSPKFLCKPPDNCKAKLSARREIKIERF